MKVEIYSDVACPWCYIGKARFERALAAFPGARDVQVSYRPFQLDPSTPRQAQPLYEYGDDVQHRVKDALLRAYFTDGRDVGDRDTLVELAAAAGMAADRTAEFLAGEDGVAQVREEIDAARAMGVQAVPTFVFDGRYAVQGAQETATFRQVLEQVAAESEPAADGEDG